MIRYKKFFFVPVPRKKIRRTRHWN